MGKSYVLYLLAFVLVSALNSSTVFGSDDVHKSLDSIESLTQPNENPNNFSILGIDGGKPSIFARTQYILNLLKISPEPSYQSELDHYSGKQTINGVTRMMRYLDTHNQFRRFSGILNGKTTELFAFQDFDSKQIEDFHVDLANQEGPPLLPLHFSPLPGKPLNGLRIALDPGHMGGDVWDERTGKAVYEFKNAKGRKVSEGMINLQTSLLMKQSFEKLGATVLITRETLGSVTKLNWDDLDVSEYAPEEILGETLTSWFLALVQSPLVGSQFDQAINNNTHIKRAYSEFMRSDYFILHADLQARSNMINQFRPDITLIIHYDTSDPASDPSGLSQGHDFTKTYVAGGFDTAEFSTRKLRRDFAEHLLDPQSWNSSVSLSRNILASMKKNLDLLPDAGLDGSAVEIEPGIQARNLNLTRQLKGSALSYVECLYYNDPREFFQFVKQDHSMMIGGVQTYYSDRLLQVASAIQEAVLSYIATNVQIP